MRPLLQRLKVMVMNLVKRGEVTLTLDDSNNYPVTQVRSLDKISNVENILPYGLCSNPPVGSLLVLFNVNSQEENKVGIANLPRSRFRDLKEGEVAVGNYLTRSVIKFSENGDIEVTSLNNNVVTIGADNTVDVTGSSTVTVGGDSTVTIEGASTINVTGDTTLTSPTVNVTAATAVNVTSPLTTITGNLTVTGLITTGSGTIGSGATTLTGTLTSNGDDISGTHVHTQGVDGNGDTQVDTGGPISGP